MSLTKRGGTALDARLSLPLPSRAKARGRTFLWWVSRGWNEEAQKFYASLGATNEPVMAHALTFSAFDTLASDGDEAGGA